MRIFVSLVRAAGLPIAHSSSSRSPVYVIVNDKRTSAARHEVSTELLTWIKTGAVPSWCDLAFNKDQCQMPNEAVIIVTAIVVAFSTLMATLAWVMWYTGNIVRPAVRD